jgi:hypothetical protein
MLVTVYNPYGYIDANHPYGSHTDTFLIHVTENQEVPVINSVSQSTTEPTANATFSADVTNLPITSYSWRFNFIPPVASNLEKPVVTLPSTANMYTGTLQVSNDAGTSQPFNFSIPVGYAPTEVDVTIPETIVLNEAATFSATCAQNTAPTPTYEWHFNLPDFDDEPSPNGSSTAIITPHDYGGERHGYVKVSNIIGNSTCYFTYYVHWNMLKLRTELVWDDELELWVEDSLPGDDGFVTVTAYIYDNGHPVGYLNSVYLEYDFTKVAPPAYLELLDSSQPYWPLWNAGTVGGEIWAADGWWQPYGTLLPFARELFFYENSGPPYVPHPSLFQERQSTCNAIYVNVSPVGGYESDIGLSGEDDYDPTVDIFSFRMFPAQELGTGDYPFTTYISCYKCGPPPNNQLLTYYSNFEDPVLFIHPFSNEPFVAIQGVAP